MKKLAKEEVEVLAEVRCAIGKYLRRAEESVVASGIRPLQFQLLLQLRGTPGRSHATLEELCERLQLKPAAAAALVRRCEDLGLVRRQPSMVDMRQIEVHVTTEGLRLVDELAPVHWAQFQALADALARPELRNKAAAIKPSTPPTEPSFQRSRWP